MSYVVQERTKVFFDGRQFWPVNEITASLVSKLGGFTVYEWDGKQYVPATPDPTPAVSDTTDIRRDSD